MKYSIVLLVNLLIFETKKEAFSKLQRLQEGNRISNEDFWKYFANLLVEL